MARRPPKPTLLLSPGHPAVTGDRHASPRLPPQRRRPRRLARRPSSGTGAGRRAAADRDDGGDGGGVASLGARPGDGTNERWRQRDPPRASSRDNGLTVIAPAAGTRRPFLFPERSAGRTIGRMGSRSSPVVVGRERELGVIERALGAAAEGRPVLLLVRGEAGIGKSRLIREAIERARGGGSAILHGSCLDLGGDGVPYLPVIEALRGLARATPPSRLATLLGPARDDLARLLPELADEDRGVVGDGEPAQRRQSGIDRARLFERFIGLLGRLGENAPVVAVVEDVQ